MEHVKFHSLWLLVHFPFQKDLEAEVEGWDGFAESKNHCQAFSHQV